MLLTFRFVTYHSVLQAVKVIIIIKAQLHTDDSHGCLLELTNGGKDSFQVCEGLNRLCLEDGDVLRLSAVASDGVGFGECIGRELCHRFLDFPYVIISLESYVVFINLHCIARLE